jgi:hypothetical protein
MYALCVSREYVYNICHLYSSTGFQIASREPLGNVGDSTTQKKIEAILAAFLRQKTQEQDFLRRDAKASLYPSSEIEQECLSNSQKAYRKAREVMQALVEQHGILHITPWSS